MTLPDVIVVGSGASGAQAAQTLVETGCSVLMLDVGLEAAPGAAPPEGSFVQLRRQDADQHAYFLGPDFVGVPRGRVGAAPQVTPPRRHVLGTAEAHAPVATRAFAAIESHARGGLAGAWGAVSFPFRDDELERSGLPVAAMRRSYERVAQRVGVSGAVDDLCAVRGPLEALLPPLPLDHNAEALLARYARRRAAFARERLWVGHPLLAVLSRPQAERRAHDGHDLDFWSDAGGSVYRPEVTLQALRQSPGFSYRSGWLVESFREEARGVLVTARSSAGDERREFRARRLVIAAGALGTTRIVLRALGAVERKVPFVCNAHLYVPCLHLRQVGHAHRERCHSLAQLSMIHAPAAGGLVQAQMYSYRSLMLFRLLQEVPLARREALWFVRALAPSLVIWAIEHEDAPSENSFCRLRADGQLEAVHAPAAAVERQRRAGEAALMRGMRRLGSWPIRRVHSGHGSSLHYGGQLPTSERDEPFTCDATGRLRGTRGVYLADGAALRYLPAKGPTFTLMANADRVAGHVAAAGRHD